MKTESDDELMCEMPVYLSKNLAGLLHVFQYPVRPSSHTYDDENFIKAQFKPENRQVELEIGLRTRAPTFDKSTGQQIALNVDGAFREKRDSEDNYYASDVMDKIVMKSTNAILDAKQYAVGIVGENSLHLTPIRSVFALRPSFSYLDIADNQNKQEKKDKSSDDEDEEKVTKVNVRFAKPDTERSILLREKSYNYLQKKMREEPWIPLSYHKYGSERSEFEARNLLCGHQNEIIDQFDLDPNAYLKKLIPAPPEIEVINPGLPSHLLSRAALNALPLQDRIQTLMINAGVVSFSELSVAVATGNTDEDSTNVLRFVQQVAVLVQGNWVLKSDLLYTSLSESGVSPERLQNARDYILYLFTKNITVNRTDAIEMLDIPGPDLTEILKGVSKCKGGKGIWMFLLPTDNTFLKRNPEVVQRQQMIWQSRHEKLSRTLKMETKNPSRKLKVKQEPKR